MWHWLSAFLIALGLVAKPGAHVGAVKAFPASFEVRQRWISDEKPVFARIETKNIVPARARVGGTVAEISVLQGDHVTLGQRIALVGDPKLALAVQAATAQMEAARAQLAQARADYQRAVGLMKADAISQAAFDAAKTAFDVAGKNLAAKAALRAEAEQQLREGQILAPATGRVLTISATAGTVVMPGDSIATVAVQDFVLRLQVPERHARFLKAGDRIRVNGADIGLGPGPKFGTITLVYPQIANGLVQADATVPGLTDYYVGERVQVWISVGERKAIVVPSSYVFTKDGIDYVRLVHKWGSEDIPVQRGLAHPTPSEPDGLEILSGLHDGDRILKPNGGTL
ncbi:MAG: efflux RND transporter periplasmic adaptor subunit [Alphaproteobacteria bacterium]|nr:efflux RND transporter periplasmic adaptor subunit [Alphaproteobacteria bacterium]